MDTIRIYQDDAGQHRWRRKASNGEIVASGESHLRRRDAQRAAQRANPDSGWTYDRGSETCE